MRQTLVHTDATLPLFCESIGYDWQQDAVTRPEGHQYYHWLQTDSGGGIVEIDGKNILLSPHSGLLIAPHIAHKYYPIDQENSHRIWQTSFMVFSGMVAAELGAFWGVDRYLYLPNLSDDTYQFLMKNYDAFKNDSLQATYSQSSLIYTFLMLMKKDIYQPQHYAYERGILTKIRDYIQGHYRENITNETLIQLSKYSTSHQNKLFREQYGMTPLEYLAKYRLKMAKIMMMLQPEEQVQVIADNCGFHDVSHFIQDFKSETGLTPFRFKKQFLSHN